MKKKFCLSCLLCVLMVFSLFNASGLSVMSNISALSLEELVEKWERAQSADELALDSDFAKNVQQTKFDTLQELLIPTITRGDFELSQVTVHLETVDYEFYDPNAGYSIHIRIAREPNTFNSAEIIEQCDSEQSVVFSDEDSVLTQYSRGDYQCYSNVNGYLVEEYFSRKINFEDTDAVDAFVTYKSYEMSELVNLFSMENTYREPEKPPVWPWVVGAVACVILIGGVVAFVILRKKKKA